MFAAHLLITPFRTQNTPPPMASFTIELTSTPVHVSFGTALDAIAVLFANGEVQVRDLSTRLPDPKAGSRLRGGGKVAEPKLDWEADFAPRTGGLPKQAAIGRDGRAVLFWTEGPNGPASALISINTKGERFEIVLDRNINRLVSVEKGWLVLDAEGTLRLGMY